MKKIIFLSLLMLFAVGNINAQAKKPKSIISTSGAAIKKFHEKSELDGMPKGQLLELYKERIRVLVNILPYLALTNKPGMTMQDVGIPDTSDNNSALDKQQENIVAFVNSTIAFQSTMVPYADKGNLVASILYYENMLRELNQLYE
ncbi:hypothetical protein [Flavobacterium oreochromis]|uniref:Uncharacterized protein n=2 Tax=Flavobacterium TaxID=237 RepID=A0A246G8F6_9FLAO|nr:hypothetical protein [Flavobacterium oreochromis]OWP74245.1 hypothetical protein BWG23_14490 [Flavobacterium oreochromis]OWP75179.1 hypothetical protein BWK62_12630 [Flavobacterium oreochromis]POR20612.1 hypothetical protein BWK58_13860 [Flavobacterium columnare]QYS87310.1 hypothetical protein JJC03_05180 [Flavobacterium oreochromis]